MQKGIGRNVSFVDLFGPRHLGWFVMFTETVQVFVKLFNSLFVRNTSFVTNSLNVSFFLFLQKSKFCFGLLQIWSFEELFVRGIPVIQARTWGFNWYWCSFFQVFVLVFFGLLLLPLERNSNKSMEDYYQNKNRKGA